MVKDCNMREACKSIFSELLKENIEQIREGKVSEESIRKTRSKLKELREMLTKTNVLVVSQKPQEFLISR